jgi:hypothetical protein
MKIQSRYNKMAPWERVSYSGAEEDGAKSSDKKEIDSDGHDDPESIDNSKVPQEASSGRLQEWY